MSGDAEGDSARKTREHGGGRSKGGRMTRSSPILVTGGADYIGSHVSLALRGVGYPLVVLEISSYPH